MTCNQDNNGSIIIQKGSFIANGNLESLASVALQYEKDNGTIAPINSSILQNSNIKFEQGVFSPKSTSEVPSVYTLGNLDLLDTFPKPILPSSIGFGNNNALAKPEPIYSHSNDLFVPDKHSMISDIRNL